MYDHNGNKMIQASTGWLMFCAGWLLGLFIGYFG